MKIRISLRRYFLVAIFFLATSTTLLFAMLSAKSFVQGLDSALSESMLAAARDIELEQGQSKASMGFVFSDSWEQQPALIRSRFSPAPQTVDKLYKSLEQDVPFYRPSAAYFAIKTRDKSGATRYVSKQITGKNPLQHTPATNPLTWIMLLTLLCLLGFSALLLLILRTISAPVERLKNWAKQLNAEQLGTPPPDFVYQELNTLGELLHQSLSEVEQSVTREQDFLRHASHELRTPIAILQSNLELLDKLSPAQDKEGQIRQRLARATKSMALITQTLLWLHRDEEGRLAQQNVALDQLLREVVDELKFLLKDKPVTLKLDTQNHQQPLPGIISKLILANLVRNAFQHTQEGEVLIRQRQHRVEICNPASIDDELGFGLGLTLVNRLCQKFAWPYTSSHQAGWHKTHIVFDQGPAHIQWPTRRR